MESSDVDITNLHVRTISTIARRHLLYHCVLSMSKFSNLSRALSSSVASVVVSPSSSMEQSTN